MEFDYKRIMEFARKVLEIPSPSGYTNNVVNFFIFRLLFYKNVVQ